MSDRTGYGAGEGGNVYLLSEHDGRSCQGRALLAFRLDNAPHLTAAFGESATRQVMELVCRVLSELTGNHAFIDRELGGLIFVLFEKKVAFDTAQLEAACANFVQDFALGIARHPIEFDGHCLHAAISGVWSPTDARRFADISPSSQRKLAAALSRVHFDGEPVGAEQGWERQYRLDMEGASRLLCGVDEDRLLFAWQPVRSDAASQMTFYHECFLRDVDPDGLIAPLEDIQALERLGLVAALDHYVVSRVVEELACDPGLCLGVNISAQSACLQSWWRDIDERLRDQPDIALRLVIEITETARISDIGQAAVFVDQMRKLGVRIALDNFGVGYASIRTLLALQPDIVKIDELFLRRATESSCGQTAFKHLVGLAGSMAADVVINGVETASQDDLATDSGSYWRQGGHYGRPSVIRPWSQVAANGSRPVWPVHAGRGQV